MIDVSGGISPSICMIVGHSLALVYRSIPTASSTNRAHQSPCATDSFPSVHERFHAETLSLTLSAPLSTSSPLQDLICGYSLTACHVSELSGLTLVYVLRRLVQVRCPSVWVVPVLTTVGICTKSMGDPLPTLCISLTKPSRTQNLPGRPDVSEKP